MTIRVLTLCKESRHPHSGYHSTAIYDQTGGLPWYKELDEEHATATAAFAAAQQWARDYENRDRYGNMASAFGVVASNGRYRGVVNYYHSNT